MPSVYQLPLLDDTMVSMDTALNAIARFVRSCMRWPAVAIDKISGGHIKPNHITLISVLGHIGVFWALYTYRPILGGLLLIFFGLMDTLDGALAKVQGRTSVLGTFYDATSDRLKEVILYAGIARFFTAGTSGYELSAVIWLPVAVVGGSLLVSYIKAKGEMVLASSGKYETQALNRLFTDGLARYEVRMAFIVLGLFSGLLVESMWVLLVLIAFTALQRTIRIARELRKLR